MSDDAAGRPPSRKLRAEERAALILHGSGLVTGADVLNGGIRLAADHRERAATITVHTGGLPRYMVKLGRRQARQSMDREILSYRAIAAGARAVAIAPRLAHADISRGELVTELLEPAVTLHDVSLQRPLLTFDVIDGLSDVIAQMALLPTGATADVPAVLPWILSRHWDGREEQIAALFPAPEVLDAVLDRLEAGRQLWRPRCLIHGDLKLDNCMMLARDPATPAQIRLIDWELAGLGDPAWDLATVVQEFLLIADMHAGRPGGPDDPRADDDAAHAAARLLAQYGRSRALTDAQFTALTDRTAGYVGCRLVQTAYELEAIEGVEGPRTQGAIARASALCQAPQAFWAAAYDTVL